MKRIDWASYREILLQAVFEQVSVQELFNRVYDLISLPMICFDVSFRLVAYAFPRPFSYMHWENIASAGSASAETVSLYHYLDSQEEIAAAEHSTVWNTGNSEGFPQACGPVRLDGNLVAYCGIMMEDTDAGDALRLNDLLIGTIQLLYPLQLRSAEDTAAEDIRCMERLLAGRDVSKRQIAGFAERYSPPYLLANVYGSGQGQSTLRYLQHWAGKRERIVSCLPEPDTVSILFYDISRKDGVLQASRVMLAIRDQFGIRGGISDFFDTPQQIANASIQTVLAFAAGQVHLQGEKAVPCFRNIFATVVLQRAIERLGAHACVYPPVEKIIQSAGDDADALLTTIASYLYYFGKTALVAETLGLHKNTVSYRIRKAEQILGGNMSDPAASTPLEIGLRIRQYIKETDETDREQA